MSLYKAFLGFLAHVLSMTFVRRHLAQLELPVRQLGHSGQSTPFLKCRRLPSLASIRLVLGRDLCCRVVLSARVALFGVEFILGYRNGFVAPNLSDFILFEKLVGVLRIVVGNRIERQIHWGHERRLRAREHSLILFRAESRLYSDHLGDLPVLAQAGS